MQHSMNAYSTTKIYFRRFPFPCISSIIVAYILFKVIWRSLMMGSFFVFRNKHYMLALSIMFQDVCRGLFIAQYLYVPPHSKSHKCPLVAYVYMEYMVLINRFIKKHHYIWSLQMSHVTEHMRNFRTNFL